MLDVSHLIESGGLLLIGFIIFAETGLLVGFFLPGDTLLFTAGFFAAQGKLGLPSLLVVLILAAIIGNEVGYEIGSRNGKRVFRKKNGVFFREEYVERAEVFYKKHGGKTIILARFVPIVRTLSAVIAGVGKMPRVQFFIYNVIGAVLWCTSVTLLGFWLGNRIPSIDKYLLPVILLASIFTFGPPIYHVWRDKRKSKVSKNSADS